VTTTLPAGVSQAAETLNRVYGEEARRQQATVTFSNFPLNDQLIDVFEHCSGAGWDGDDSIPVDPVTLQIAKRLVEALPTEFRTPTISGEPDGHVCLEWYVNSRRILTVSVNPNGTLHWAALIGDEDPRGSCHFYGDAPATMLYWIGRVCKK
jgi:hypothetical protein